MPGPWRIDQEQQSLLTDWLDSMKTFVVLGMHGSATSLVSEGLGHLVEMGDNFDGHFENKSFVELNDRILRAAGGSWLNPPPESEILALADRFDLEIREAVEAASHGRERWGWKDPRTTLTVRLYLPHLTQPHFIAVFREPQEVVGTLMRRDGTFKDLGAATATALVSEYNQRLLEFLRDFATC